MAYALMERRVRKEGRHTVCCLLVGRLPSDDLPLTHCQTLKNGFRPLWTGMLSTQGVATCLTLPNAGCMNAALRPC